MELFRYPLQFVWLSAALAALLFFYFKARTAAAQAAAALIDGGQLARLVGEKALAARRTRERLYLAALVLLVAAAGGPQWGKDMTPVTDLNGSLAIAVDTSLSMGARDLKPSRMENARLLLNALADKFQDYRMGIIAFSGDAYVQCPLTTDSDAVKYFLSYLAPGMLPVPGTNIGAAIGEAANMLGRYSGQKVLVLITDGEDTEGRIDEALGQAASSGLRIFTVGIGKTEGELIPADGGYKKDSSGKTVVTRLDEAALLKIAQRTGAEYIRYGGDPEAAASEIRATVARLAMSRTKGFGRPVYRNRYRFPLLLAFLLLLAEFMFMEKGLAARVPAAGLLKRISKKAGAALPAALAFLLAGQVSAQAASPASLARSGNGAYRKKDFPKAYDYYTRALDKDPRDARILFNRGDAFYRMEDYAKAAEDAEEAAKSPKLKGAASYNAGNAYFKLSDFRKAAASYREALLADPGDRNARYNLQKTLLELKKAEQNKKQDQDKQNEKKQDQKKQEQKQNQGGGGGGQDEKKKEEQRRQQAARQEADKLLELMKEKEKENGSRELMNARFSNKPREKEKFSGKDW